MLAAAESEGWAGYIRNRSDLVALLDGCWFDQTRVDRVIKFASLFRIPEGPSAGKPFKLLGYQLDIIHRLFGWIKPDERHKTGWSRRFRKAFVIIPKKQGKTVLASLLLLYGLIGDGEARPSVYAAAKDRGQATKLFDDARQLLMESKLKAWVDEGKLEILKGVKVIDYPEKFGSMKTLSADAGKADGISSHFTVIDELHEAKNDKLFSTLAYAGRARVQPLTIIITTAGDDRDSVCFLEYQVAKKVIAGEHVDTRLLPVVYEAPEGADIADPATWRMANPALGEVLSEADFADDYNSATTSASETRKFCRYRLNIWSDKNQSAGFVTRAQWDACAGDFPSEEELAKLPLYLGIDLGRSDDFSAVASVWKDTDKYYVKVALWNPEETIAAKALLGRWPYREWTDAGWITACDGATVDIEDIQGELARLVQTYQVREIAYDGYTAGDMIKKWDIEGYTTVQVQQKIMNLSAPTKEFERLILSKELVHDGNPVLAWMISNVFIISDASGNIRIDKKRSAEKIDGIAAIINALSRAMLSVQEDTPYQGCGFVVI